MSVETVKIRPEIDAAALRKAEEQLGKAFSPTGQAVSGLKKAFNGFYREANKVGDALRKDDKTAKEWAKSVATAERNAQAMRRELLEVEQTLGRSHRTVRAMRAEYAKVALEVARVSRSESRRSMLLGTDEGAITAQLEGMKKRLKSRGLLGLGADALGAGAAGIGRMAAGAARVGGLAALGIGAGAVAAASQIRAEMDRAAKSANLTVREFGRLKHAAELSGTSVEAVEKATSVLGKNLSKGKLDEGFAGGLRALGVAAKDLAGLSPEEQLAVLADALKGVQDEGQRTQIAIRLFGDELGAKMVPMLENGGSALRAAGDEAEALGLVFSADAAAAAERLGDAQDKLAKAIHGTLTEAFAGLVPMLAETAERMVEWAKANREALSEKLQAGLARVVELAKALWARLQEVDWDAWGARLEAVVTLLSGLAKALGGLMDQLGPMGSAFAALGIKIGLALGPLGALSAAALAVGVAFGSMAADAASAIDATLVKVRAAQAEALKVAQEQEIAGLREDIEAPVRISEENRKAADKILENELFLRGAKSIKDLPPDVRRKIERISVSGRKDFGRAEVERTNAAANKKRAKALETKPTPKAGKPEEGAGAAQVRKDIEDLASRYAEREYQRAIQGGASLEEAKKRELEARKRAKKELSGRAGELAKAGFVGGAGGPTFVGGVGTTAGGAIPVSLDLGGRGGPPPVQIISVMQNAEVEIPIQAVATAAEVEGAIRTGISRVIREEAASALQLADSGLRR